MDRKIVELLMKGTSVKRIARSLRVSKTRVRRLREQAKEYGYLNEEGGPGEKALPAYPEGIFPDLTDGRTLKLSESHQRLTPHHEWIRDRLEGGWHAVTVFEELPVKDVTRSSFYRYLERYKLNRLGESYRVVPGIVHKPGEALILDWGKLRNVIDPVTGKKRLLWMFAGGFGIFAILDGAAGVADQRGGDAGSAAKHVPGVGRRDGADHDRQSQVHCSGGLPL